MEKGDIPKPRPARRRAPRRRAIDDYATLASGLGDPCFIVDRQDRVRYQNAVAAELFGTIAPGRPLSFLLRAPQLTDVLQTCRESGEPATVTYFERVPTERWFEARAVPLAESSAGADFALLLLRDLTESQRVERMRADFVANASHELRTPLASLTGFIETLQGPARDDPEARARFLDIMAAQAWRMSRLIEDLMSLSRIEMKAHVRPDAAVDLAPLIGHVVEAMEPIARDSGVMLHIDLPAGPFVARGERDELAQVFQNLLANAVKYGQSGKRVEIGARRRDAAGERPARIVVWVRDHGPGIAAEHVPRLTERFYRVDTASSREKGGTGLGLAIVKHIVNRHRGELRIDSSPGHGATFTVELEAATG